MSGTPFPGALCHQIVLQDFQILDICTLEQVWLPRLHLARMVPLIQSESWLFHSSLGSCTCSYLYPMLRNTEDLINVSLFFRHWG